MKSRDSDVASCVLTRSSTWWVAASCLSCIGPEGQEIVRRNRTTGSGQGRGKGKRGGTSKYTKASSEEGDCTSCRLRHGMTSLADHCEHLPEVEVHQRPLRRLIEGDVRDLIEKLQGIESGICSSSPSSDSHLPCCPHGIHAERHTLLHSHCPTSAPDLSRPCSCLLLLLIVRPPYPVLPGRGRKH